MLTMFKLQTLAFTISIISIASYTEGFEKSIKYINRKKRIHQFLKKFKEKQFSGELP